MFSLPGLSVFKLRRTHYADSNIQDNPERTLLWDRTRRCCVQTMMSALPCNLLRNEMSLLRVSMQACRSRGLMLRKRCKGEEKKQQTRTLYLETGVYQSGLLWGNVGFGGHHVFIQGDGGDAGRAIALFVGQFTGDAQGSGFTGQQILVIGFQSGQDFFF